MKSALKVGKLKSGLKVSRCPPNMAKMIDYFKLVVLIIVVLVGQILFFSTFKEGIEKITRRIEDA